MKKIAGLLFLFAFCLMAADFWQKPYTEWTDKDLQKMMNNSPWAHTVSVSMGGPIASPDAGGGGGRGGGAVAADEAAARRAVAAAGRTHSWRPRAGSRRTLAIRHAGPAGFRTSEVRRRSRPIRGRQKVSRRKNSLRTKLSFPVPCSSSCEASLMTSRRPSAR